MIAKTTYGYLAKGRDSYLHILFYGEGCIRLAYSKNEEIPKSTPAVIAEYCLKVSTLEDDFIVIGNIKLHVGKDLCISIYDSSGNLINRDFKIDRDNISIKKELLWEKGFYGMGEKYSWLNLKGSETCNWNTDVIGLDPIHHPHIKEYHTSIPFYIGMDEQRCYGIYFDNSYKTSFDFGFYDQNIVSFKADGGCLDYYFFYGSKVSEILKEYTHLTGRMPLPRKAYLGYQQCRWSYGNRQELMEIAIRMRQEGIPCDVLYLDIDYMKDYKVFTIDSDKFHEFKEMLEILGSMGYKVVVIIDPGVKVAEGYDVYEEGTSKDYFVKTPEGGTYTGEVWPGKAVYPDFLRKEVRQWWGRLHSSLLDEGVDGIWNDMNEPSDFTTESKTLPENVIHFDDDGTSRTHREIHNLYAMLEAEATYEVLKELEPKKRPFILTRAAFAGTQRYAALWTGDNSSVWEHLEISLPMYMNLGLSGYSFIGGDVGGFIGEGNGELLARWTQVGAFTPLFRNHSCKGTRNQEPWSFGKEILNVSRKYIELRYRLIPYLYTLMSISSRTGEPVIRPLFYHHQQDDKVLNINDQFLFGEGIMICPITKPGIKARLIYLPEGIWYDFWTDEEITGGKYIIRESPLDTLPIYIKGGAVIPMTSSMNYVGEREENLDIHIYNGGKSEFTHYIDDGESFKYEKGVFSEIKFSLSFHENSAVIASTILHKQYPIPGIKLHLHGFSNYKRITLEDENIEMPDTKVFVMEVPVAFSLILYRC